MKTTTLLLSLIISLFTLTVVQADSRSILDSQTAGVTMVVPFYASITGLDRVALSTAVIGKDRIELTGSETFQLESNGQARVTVVAKHANLNNTSIQYSLDGKGASFKTAANKTHKGTHTVAIRTTTTLQEFKQASSYSNQFTLTVSEL